MATTLDLTSLQGLQDQIHTKYTAASDTPPEGSEDWIVRQRLINDSISYWANQENVEWLTLWLTETGGTLSTSSDIGLPDDLNKLGSVQEDGKVTIRLIEPGTNRKTFLTIVSPTTAQEYMLAGKRAFYMTGSPGAYDLHPTWIVTEDDPYFGWTIEFDYYKYANVLEKAKDRPEMSKPEFIIDDVVAKLFQQQSPTQYQIHFNRATDLMQQMLAANQRAYQTEEAGLDIDIGA